LEYIVYPSLFISIWSCENTVLAAIGAVIEACGSISFRAEILGLRHGQGCSFANAETVNGGYKTEQINKFGPWDG
jgi:hypothetical protein